MDFSPGEGRGSETIVMRRDIVVPILVWLILVFHPLTTVYGNVEGMLLIPIFSFLLLYFRFLLVYTLL